MTASGIFRSLSLYVLSSFLKVGTRNFTPGRRIDSATGFFMPRPDIVIMADEEVSIFASSRVWPLSLSSLRIARLLICGAGREADVDSFAGADLDRDSLLSTWFFAFAKLDIALQN